MPNGLEIRKDNIEEEVIGNIKEIEKLQLTIKIAKNREQLKQVSQRFEKVVNGIDSDSLIRQTHLSWSQGSIKPLRNGRWK